MIMMIFELNIDAARKKRVHAERERERGNVLQMISIIRKTMVNPPAKLEKAIPRRRNLLKKVINVLRRRKQARRIKTRRKRKAARGSSTP